MTIIARTKKLIFLLTGWFSQICTVTKHGVIQLLIFMSERDVSTSISNACQRCMICNVDLLNNSYSIVI